MKQTPAHEIHNPDLLKLIPKDAKKIIEVGCSSGALAREYKKINADCNYIGIEISSDYGKLAERYCDKVIIGNIEELPLDFYNQNSNVDCWIFADVLEHLKDPWGILRKINSVLSQWGSVAACIPNVQHWSVQAKISTGDFRYVDMGILDRTHLRWFTRKTIIELFDSTGFEIKDFLWRDITSDPRKDDILQIIKELAFLAGSKPEEAELDASHDQYLILATPRIT